MRHGGVARGLGVALVTLALLAPAAAAQAFESDLHLYPPPATDNARSVEGLYNVILALGLLVFVFVEALLLYVLWRFRRNKETPPVGETHRGHTKAEIAWTVAPALILIFIGGLSAQTLDALDTIPEDTDYAIRVEGFQFGWRFKYPDPASPHAFNSTPESTFNQLYVEEGSRVRLEITGVDVIHSFWVPEFAIKLDAVPGRINTQWFDAPAPGTYYVQCAEYCGVGHHAMRAEIVVFPRGQGPNGLSWGQPEDAGTGGGEVLEGEATVDMRDVEFQPATLRVRPGTTVTWVNFDAAEHTVTPLDKEQWGTEGSGDSPSQWLGRGEEWSFTFEEPGTYDYRCIPHSFRDSGSGEWQGMLGTVVVEAAA